MPPIIDLSEVADNVNNPNYMKGGHDGLMELHIEHNFARSIPRNIGKSCVGSTTSLLNFTNKKQCL
jgi:hypothetical protein